MCEIAWSESTEIRGDASLLLSLSRERSRMGELATERWTLDLSLSEKEKERYSSEGVGEIGTMIFVLACQSVRMDYHKL